MESIEKVQEISIHGNEYIFKINATNDNLQLDLELKNTGQIWKNNFTSQYLEEITQKTGSFKKYSVFVKMLLTSITQQSDSVFVDILTSSDLEQLKSRKNQFQQRNSVDQNSSSLLNQSKLKNNNKRYIILTYAVEFDKVHYPLPLNFEDIPDIKTLQNTIKILKKENEELKYTKFLQNNSDENLFLKKENEFLKLKLKRLEDTIENQLNTEKNILQKEKITTDIELIKEQFSKQIKSLTDKILEQEQELEYKNSIINQLDKEKKQIQDDQSCENRNIEQKLTKEIDTLKMNDKKQKQKIHTLENELDDALKRITQLTCNQAQISTKSLSRGKSPSLSKSNSQQKIQYSPSIQRKSLDSSQKNRIQQLRYSSASESDIKKQNYMKNTSNSRSKSRNGDLLLLDSSSQRGTPKRQSNNQSFNNGRISPKNSNSQKKSNKSLSKKLSQNSPRSDVSSFQIPQKKHLKEKSNQKWYQIDNNHKKQINTDKNNNNIKLNRNQLLTHKNQNNNIVSDSEDEFQSVNQRISNKLNNLSNKENNPIISNQSKFQTKNNNTDHHIKVPPTKDYLDTEHSQSEVSDIDQRLSKLQELLRLAKS